MTETCFFERDPGLPLLRRATVKGLGTLLLMLAATGSGLTAQQLFSGSPALGLLASAVATAGALVGLILAFGAVSGGHFNPLITGLQWLAGERRLDCTLAYVAAQLLGGLAGAMLASTTFDAVGQPAKPPSMSWTLAASEIVASAGLMIVVFGCARSGQAETGPFAVGAWLTAAIIATPPASYANPAIVIGALAAAGPIALPAPTALLYVPAEVAGALLAFLAISSVYPQHRLKARLTARPVMAPNRVDAMTPDGLSTRRSSFGPKETADRLAAAVTARGMAVLARIDHAAAAAEVGLELRPTEVLIFGNPRAGTPLMQAAPTIGIDLPLRALVWQDDTGATWLTHSQPAWLADRHGVRGGTDQIVVGMSQALAVVVTEATAGAVTQAL